MKEQFEWIHSWCDEAANDDLPRVLLVGDSIVDGYQAKVRELLHGVCYVDFIATSYGIDTKMYATLLLAFMTDSEYALIHFNNGLHGVHITKRTYQSCLPRWKNEAKFFWQLLRFTIKRAISGSIHLG